MNRKLFSLLVLGIISAPSLANTAKVIGRASLTCCEDPTSGEYVCKSDGNDLRAAADADAENRCRSKVERVSDYQTQFRIKFSCQFTTVYAEYVCVN